MYKEGWCVVDEGRMGLREGGGNCLEYFKRGWNGKEGRRTKDFKKEGASWVKG